MFREILARCRIQPENRGVYAGRWIERPGGEELVSLNPTTGEPLARVIGTGQVEYGQAIESARSAFERWRLVPPPQRGD